MLGRVVKRWLEAVRRMLRGSAGGQKVAEGQAREALFLANVRDSVIVTDMAGLVTYWNEGATRLFGWSAEEMLGRPLLERFPEAERPGVAELTRRVAAGEEFSGEFEDWRKDGSRVWIDARVTRISDDADAGRPIGLMGIAHDVTARKQAEAERDRLVARLRLQIERMPLGYLLLDADLRIIDWSSAAERIFGYPKEEVLGMGPPYEKILPPGERPETDQILSRLRAGDMAAHAINDNFTKDGRRITCEWYNTPLVDDDGTFLGAISLAQDITEQRRLEEQYRHAQRMEAIGQLAGGVAHDFNNLLTVIQGYSNLLLRDSPKEGAGRLWMEEIRGAGERAAVLVRQLLTFSRREVVAPKVLDLNEVLADIQKMLRRIIGEDVELSISPDTELGAIQADPGQIEQVIMNLAVNARDAMPRGGRLTVETANVELDERDASGRLHAQPGSYVRLSVTDTGSGMTPEVRARIFEPFFTTKEAGRGTGLGLSVVHGIVEQGSGHVEVRSEPGAGTTFEIHLPRIDRPAGPAGPRHELPPAPEGSETVLVVEDDDAVRALTLRALARSGYRMLEAACGEEALRVAGKHEGKIDLLLTDVVMPGVGGRELAARLARLHPEAKVLYLSGYTDDAVLRHGVLHQEVSFLQKPFSPRALAHKVREVLDSS